MTDKRQRGLTGIEPTVYYSFDNDGDIYNAKILLIAGDTSFIEETITEPSYPAGGVRLFAGMETIRDPDSEADLVITVNGWRQNAAAITGTAKIRAHAAEREAVEFAVDGGYLFQGISSVAITGGSSGEKVTLFFLPAVTTFHELGFNPVISGVEGGYFFVPNRLDPADHKKRRANEITVEDLYKNAEGITNVLKLKGHKVMLLDQKAENGGADIGKVVVYRLVKISRVRRPAPNYEGTDVTVAAAGTYSRRFEVGAVRGRYIS